MSKRMFLGVVCAATALNVAILIANLSSPSIAGVAAEVPEELGPQVDTTVKAITELPTLLGG